MAIAIRSFDAGPVIGDGQHDPTSIGGCADGHDFGSMQSSVVDQIARKLVEVVQIDRGRDLTGNVEVDPNAAAVAGADRARKIGKSLREHGDGAPVDRLTTRSTQMMTQGRTAPPPPPAANAAGSNAAGSAPVTSQSPTLMSARPQS